MIPFLILISIATTITTTCLAYDPEMYLKENDNFGGTKEDYYMNDFKGQYRYSFENPNTIKQFQDGFANGDKVGFYAFVGPDKRFYITCYTAINGYRAKSIIVVTDMPYEDLQDFCQKKFNVVTNSFEDLSDVKKFIENKKKSEITTTTTTTTTLKNVKNKISVPIAKVKGQPVDKIIFENSSEGGIITGGKLITDSGISSKIDISSSGKIRGKPDISIGSRSSDDHSVKINENINTNLKLIEKSPSSPTRGRGRGRGKGNGNKNIAVDEIKRGGKASIITGDVPTHLNIQIDVPHGSGTDKKIHSKISGKTTEEISTGNLPQKTKQVIKTPDTNIELVGGKIPLTDAKKYEPETEILIPIVVKSSTNSDKTDTIFSTIGSIDKNSDFKTIDTTSSRIPTQLLDIPIPDEVYFPESLSPKATFDPTNGKSSGGSTTIKTQSGITKKEKVTVSNTVTEKSKSPAAQIPAISKGINKITVDTTRGKSSIEIDTEKIVPSKIKGKPEKSVIQQNIVTSELTKGKSTSQTVVGVNLNNEKSGSLKSPGTNEKLIIEEPVLQKTKGHSTNKVQVPSIDSEILRNTKTNTVLTSNKPEKNDITIESSISKTNIPALENSVLPTPALENTRIIGMRGSASFSVNGRGGSAGSDYSDARSGGSHNRGNGSGSGSSVIGGNVINSIGSGGSNSSGNGKYVVGSGGADGDIKYTDSGITGGNQMIKDNKLSGSIISGSGFSGSSSSGGSDSCGSNGCGGSKSGSGTNVFTGDNGIRANISGKGSGGGISGSGIIASGSGGHITGDNKFNGAIISGKGSGGGISGSGIIGTGSGIQITGNNKLNGAIVSGKGSAGGISGSGIIGTGTGGQITGDNKLNAAIISGKGSGGGISSSGIIGTGSGVQITGNNKFNGALISGSGFSGGSNSGASASCGGNGCGSSKSGSGTNVFTGNTNIAGANISGKGSGVSISSGSGLSKGGDSGGYTGGSTDSSGTVFTIGNGGTGTNIRGNKFGGTVTSGFESSVSGGSSGGRGGGGGSDSSAGGKISGNGFGSKITVDNGSSGSSGSGTGGYGGGGGGGSGFGSGTGITPNQCVGQLVTKVITQPVQTVTVTIQPTQTQKSTVSVPTALSGNSCRAKIVVEDSNKKLLVLHPTEAEMESIKERAAKSLNCGHLTFLSK